MVHTGLEPALSGWKPKVLAYWTNAPEIYIYKRERAGLEPEFPVNDSDELPLILPLQKKKFVLYNN
jgi:hypothetical protein